MALAGILLGLGVVLSLVRLLWCWRHRYSFFDLSRQERVNYRVRFSIRRLFLVVTIIGVLAAGIRAFPQPAIELALLMACTVFFSLPILLYFAFLAAVGRINDDHHPHEIQRR
jgi:uncharacterized Tic20 family protein